jgi:hypothetical protein
MPSVLGDSATRCRCQADWQLMVGCSAHSHGRLPLRAANERHAHIAERANCPFGFSDKENYRIAPDAPMRLHIRDTERLWQIAIGVILIRLGNTTGNLPVVFGSVERLREKRWDFYRKAPISLYFEGFEGLERV